ncbi:hypothetical protein AALP_AA3G266700 [Arabis alpina]|uniref:Uncharacterized protein n=1 Tax=Arabis alpina TaxID=50452 RepID=A0A087HBW2_ARAAL|nr:hypothetical protein AALP_AA3G266700 [Arabis alpina]
MKSPEKSSSLMNPSFLFVSVSSSSFFSVTNGDFQTIHRLYSFVAPSSFVSVIDRHRERVSMIIVCYVDVSEVIEKAKEKINDLKKFYGRLAEILRECPGQYYRYHGDWRSET